MPKCREGREATAVRWLAGGEAQLDAGTIERLGSLKASLEKESNVVIVFGAELTGAAIRDLVKFGSSLPGQTRYMALGDYANSRGAADMGLLPDMLPGYALRRGRKGARRNSARCGARSCRKSRDWTRAGCSPPRPKDNCTRSMSSARIR